MSEKTRILSEGPRCMDYVANKTGLDRAACKSLIYAMIYGGPVIGVCKYNKLDLDSIIAIRMAFDDFIEGK